MTLDQSTLRVAVPLKEFDVSEIIALRHIMSDPKRLQGIDPAVCGRIRQHLDEGWQARTEHLRAAEAEKAFRIRQAGQVRLDAELSQRRQARAEQAKALLDLERALGLL